MVGFVSQSEFDHWCLSRPTQRQAVSHPSFNGYIPIWTFFFRCTGFLLPSIHSAPPFFTSGRELFNELRSNTELPYHLENSRILPRNRSPLSNGFVSSWPMPVIGSCSSCVWRMLRRLRVIGQRSYGMNVSIVSYRYASPCGYLMEIYGSRKDNTESPVKHHGSHDGRKPCSLWTSKANAFNIDILALTWRMGGSPLRMGTNTVLKVTGMHFFFSSWPSRWLILGNWTRLWLSTISPIPQ